MSAPTEVVLLLQFCELAFNFLLHRQVLESLKQIERVIGGLLLLLQSAHLLLLADLGQNLFPLVVGLQLHRRCLGEESEWLVGGDFA